MRAQLFVSSFVLEPSSKTLKTSLAVPTVNLPILSFLETSESLFMTNFNIKTPMETSGPEDEFKDSLHCSLVGIELFNFKSYRGHHIVGPFTDLTAIVGANGSGKSNLLDAISFALCVRSNKQRARNIGDLVSLKEPVYNNSNSTEEEEDQWDAEETRLAFVKLVLRSRPTEGADSTVPQEFTFQRSIMTNRTSQYKADERVCSLADYKRQLHRLRLDANSNIFLLFQGTIDALVTKSSDKLTKVIEELSGSGAYAPDYNRLKKDIKVKSDQLMTVKQERTSLLRSKEFIKSMLDSRQAGENITGQIEQLKSQLALLDLQENATKLDAARERLQMAENELGEAETAIDGLERAKNQARQALETATAAATSAETDHRRTALELESTEKDKLRKLESKLTATQKRLVIAQKKAAELTCKREAMREDVTKYRDELETIDRMINERNEQLQGLQQAEGGGLHLTADQQMEFIRLKQVLQQELAGGGDRYSKVAEHEQAISRSEREMAVLERDIAYLISERTTLEAASGENVERACQALAQDLTTLSASLEEAKAEEAAAKEKRQKAGQEVQEQGHGLEEARRAMKDKFASLHFNRKRMEEKAKVEHLVKAYKGRVHGRLGALCKPHNRNFLNVYGIAARQYLNTVLVDSVATVREVMAQEVRSAYESLKFLPLDALPPRGSRPAAVTTSLAPLREAVKKIRSISNNNGNEQACHLLYDLIRLPPEVANIERALLLAVGNVVVAPDRSTASLLVRQLRQCRAISAQCGTYYKNSVEIVADYGSRGGGNGAQSQAFEEDAYQAEESRVARKERELAAAQQALTEATTALEPVTAKVVRINAQLNIKQKHLDDLRGRLGKHKARLEELAAIIPAKQEELKAAQKQLTEQQEKLANLRAATVEEVFGHFFRQFENHEEWKGDLAKFEAAFYGQDGRRCRVVMEELEHLNRKREAIQAKMVVFPTTTGKDGEISQTNAIDSTIMNWEKKVEEEGRKVVEVEAEVAAAREAFAEKQAQLTVLRELAQKAVEARREAAAAAKKATHELETGLRRQTDAHYTLVAGRKAVRSLVKTRFELFRTAYVEAVSLPVDSQLLAELVDDDDSEDEEMDALEEVAALAVDYGAIEELLAEIAAADEDEKGKGSPARKKRKQKEGEKNRNRQEIKHALQTELKVLEDELKKLTVAEDVDLSEEESELRRKMRANAAAVRKLENELYTLRNEFGEVMCKRQKLFSAYLEAVADRLDVVYKALARRADAQAILLPLDGEEGYLAGLHYSCIAPGKQYQEMRLMSGGERCLAAFAFIYAVYPAHRLPSFFVMDELDGSLDGANIERLLGFVKDRRFGAGQTQFIFISHNVHLIGQVDSLIGVTREDVHNGESLVDRSPEATTASPTYFTSRTFSLDLREYDELSPKSSFLENTS